jgi:hypothetical protein
MDPWLESYWGDMHHRIIQYSCDQVEAQLPPGLVAMVESTVYLIDDDWERRRMIRPDFAVVDYGGSAAASPEAGALAVAEPVRIAIPEEPYTQGHIEIRELGSGRALVTAIEVISPTNKLDPYARSAYLRKRKEYYAAKISVVEIDLLRVGEHLIGVPLEGLESQLNTPYKCAVRRGGELAGAEVEYYPLPLRARLSRIHLPLRPADADIVLDLQLPIDESYKRGRYATQIDYDQAPQPPLSAADAAWAAELIAKSA